jgi:hypothetical protein
MATGVLNSRAWKAASRRHRERHPRCECCHHLATVTLHRVPLWAAPERLFDPSNLVSVCRRRHCRAELTRVLLL